MTRTIRSAEPIQPMIGDSDPFAARQSPYLTTTGEPDYIAIQDSEEFQQLRRRIRRFVFPTTVLFLGWFMTYVLFAAYDHEFMSRKLVGEVNVGIVFGVLQFVTTVGSTVLYGRYARKKIDPEVAKVRELVGAEDE